MKQKILKLTSVAFAISLAGCKADLEPTDIQVDEKLTPNQILYKSEGNQFSRQIRVDEKVEGDADETTYVYFYEGAVADKEQKAITYPVTGLSVGSMAPISVTSVQEVSGTCFDPDVLNHFVSLTACEAESSYIDEDGLEIEIKPEPDDVIEQNKFGYELASYTDVATGITSGTEAEWTTAEGSFENGTVIKPTFVLTDTDWIRKYRAVLDIGGQENEYLIETVARDPKLILTDEFLLSDYENWKPGRTVHKEIKFSGANIKAPVVIQKEEGKTYEVKYQTIDMAEPVVFVDQDIYLRKGEPLNLFVTTPEKDTDGLSPEEIYDISFTTTVTLGEVTPALDEHGNLLPDDPKTEDNTITDSFKVHSYAEDYVPGPTTEILFPPQLSATTSNSITVRGLTYVNLDQAEFSQQEEINVTEIDIEVTDSSGDPIPGAGMTLLPKAGDTTGFERSEEDDVTVVAFEREITLKAYRWQAEVDLLDSYNQITVIAKSDLEGKRPSEGQPTKVTVETEGSLTYYPDSMAGIYLEGLSDITIDNRVQENSTLLMSAKSQLGSTGSESIIWSYPLAQTVPIQCMATMKKQIKGIQFNHQKPEVGGVFLGSHSWISYYISDASLADGSVRNGDSDQRLQYVGNAPEFTGHMAWDESGTVLITASQSNDSISVRDQQIVGSLRFKFPDDGAYNHKSGAHNVSNGNRVTQADVMGAIAKETNSNEDDQKVLNNGFSVDIYTLSAIDSATGNEVTEEWVVSLDGKENGVHGGDLNRSNSGEVLLRTAMIPAGIEENDTAIKAHDPEKATRLVNLVDAENGNAIITLEKASAIAVDDARGFAYIAVPQHEGVGKDDIIWKVDLKDIRDDSISEWSATRLLTNEGIDEDSAMRMDNISSLVLEAGLDYILAADKGQQGVFAIDPVTREKVYILKGDPTEPTGDSTAYCQ